MTIEDSDYRVRLDIFEGPIDLLVYLIKKNDIDIYDIPISMITEQYLYHIEFINSVNTELAAEFLLMAATLAQIKSKMLLPFLQDSDSDNQDPRDEITVPLIEYLQIKSAAKELGEKNILGINTFVRNPDIKEFLSDKEPQSIKVGLFELIDAFSGIMNKLSLQDQININPDTISIKEKINDLIEILREKKSETFSGLLEQSITKIELIVTFLALLEMVKLNIIDIVQSTQKGVIRIILN